MCEPPARRSSHWRGWVDVPPPQLSMSQAPWADLSHELTEDLDRIPFLPAPRIRRIASLPEQVANITEVQMVCHFGTHVDAPCHFIADGPAMHEVPLERFYGRAVVWSVDVEPFGLIEPRHFEQAHPRLERGDIVLIDSGWARLINMPGYAGHPSLSAAAAQWLVHHGAKMVGVDFATPDLAVSLRSEDFDFPVHHILLSHGVLIAEHVTNVAQFAGRRIDAMFLPLNIAGADGAPCRAVARQAAP